MYWVDLHGGVIMHSGLTDGSNVVTIVNSTRGEPGTYNVCVLFSRYEENDIVYL